MTEYSIPWDGTTVGDATFAPYAAEEWAANWLAMFMNDASKQGVIPGFLNDLAPSYPDSNTVRLNTGTALVDGTVYSNDALINFPIVTPGAGSNYYTLVLRKSWAAQTVRAVLLGPDTVTYPVVTQVNLTTWEIELARVRKTSAGVVTATDTRRYCNIRGLPAVLRQSTSANDWASPGTINAITGPALAITQMGCIDALAASPGVTVTFPRAFSYLPLVQCQVFTPTAGSGIRFALVSGLTTTGFEVTVFDSSESEVAASVMWQATGPLV